MAVALGLRPRHLVSTICPRELDRALEDIFVTHHPDIHYSIYSVSERFRRRWLPKALPAAAALDRLVSWQRNTDKVVTLHHAYIAGENDAEGDVHAICDALEERRLMVHVNIVRYNTPDPARHGVEPPEAVIERNAAIYRERLPSARVSVIARVGFDVAASCGMFFGPGGPTA
jgi:23S rRNA (adenine2503-C2)-methyltransferase